MRDLYYNRDLNDPEDRGYGLDANIRVQRIDNNNTGIIETADEAGKRDKVYLFFGQRRGGSTYYAIDVSTKTSPKVMWARDYVADLAGQSARHNGPEPSSSAHSSSQTCGVIGASMRTMASHASRITARDCASLRLNFARRLLSSMIAAIAVLNV
jgi:hypothetical protein